MKKILSIRKRESSQQDIESIAWEKEVYFRESIEHQIIAILNKRGSEARRDERQETKREVSKPKKGFVNRFAGLLGTRAVSGQSDSVVEFREGLAVGNDQEIRSAMKLLVETMLHYQQERHQMAIGYRKDEQEMAGVLREIDQIKARFDSWLNILFMKEVQIALGELIEQKTDITQIKYLRTLNAIQHDIRSKSPEELVKIIQDNVVARGDLKLAINCLDAL